MYVDLPLLSPGLDHRLQKDLIGLLIPTGPLFIGFKFVLKLFVRLKWCFVTLVELICIQDASYDPLGLSSGDHQFQLRRV